MTHESNEEMSARAVVAAAQEVGCVIDAVKAQAIANHTMAVLRRNAVLNLTRITDTREVLRLHIMDSLTALKYVQDAPDGMVADIGSGAGYPGIPLAIATGRQFTLVESVKKKAAFLSEVCRDLHLDVEVLPLRAEEVAEAQRRAFSAVTARALSSLPALVELASPLLAMGGRLVAMKGNPEHDEITAGERVARIVGLKMESIDRFVLPGGGEQRTIIVYRAYRESGVRLPRRPGMAQRHPLP